MLTHTQNHSNRAESQELAWLALAAGTSPPSAGIAAFHAFPSLVQSLGDAHPARVWEQFQAARRDARLRRQLEKQLGHALPISPAEAPCVLAEVQRHKWLVAEKAGRDVWAELDPRDPVRPAVVDWFRHHFGEWYRSRALRRGRPGALLVCCLCATLIF